MQFKLLYMSICLFVPCIAQLETPEADELLTRRVNKFDTALIRNQLSAGELYVGGDTIINHNLQVNNDVEIQGNETIHGNLRVTGQLLLTSSLLQQNCNPCTNVDNLTVANNLAVGGNETLQGNLSVNGNETIQGNLTVGGDLILSDTSTVLLSGNVTLQNLTVTNNLSVNGNETIQGGLTVAGNLVFSDTSIVLPGDVILQNLTANNNLTVSRSLSVNGNETVQGSLTVVGDLILSDTSIVLPGDVTLQNLTVNNNLSVNRNLTVSGNETIQGNLTVGGIITGSVAYTYPATAAILRTVQGKLNDYWDVRDFGAVGDGVTNNLTAFTNAFAAISAAGGGELFVPKGTYLIPFTTATALSLPANIVLRGEGSKNSILKFAPDAQPFKVALNNNVSNVTLRNIAVTLQGTPGQTIIIFQINTNCNNFTLDNVELDGRALPGGSHAAHGLSFPNSGTQRNIVVNQCEIHNLGFPFLKSVAQSSIQQGIYVYNSKFYNNLSEDVSFNSPLGTQSEIVVDGCTITDNVGYLLGNTTFAVAIAFGSNIRISNNYIAGRFNDAIHIEGIVHQLSIENNIVNTFGSGIRIYPGGTGTEKCVVIGNILTFTGATMIASDGISLIYDGYPDSPAKRTIVTDNIITGSYGVGIVSKPGVAEFAVISNNLVRGAGIGYHFINGGFDCTDNISSHCGLGVMSEYASVDKHFFHNCTTTATTNNKHFVALNPVMIFTADSIPAGATNFNLLRINANDRLAAKGNIYIRGASCISSRQFDVTWSGSGLTVTPVITQDLIITSTFINNGGNLALQINSPSQQNSIQIEVSLEGMYILTP